ncbi:MAG: hypothetical protein M1826_003905 [Phylliscum demangeonii]|nr:MAG: hypothetical protein M1826_003905 [Phylliscum demangeonii]
MALLLLASWLRPLSGSATSPYAGDDIAAAAGWHAPACSAAYEEWWRREESGLWDWLDERVELDRLAVARPLPPPTTGARTRTPLHAPPPLPAKLAEARMSALDEAIHVTQNRLDESPRWRRIKSDGSFQGVDGGGDGWSVEHCFVCIHPILYSIPNEHTKEASSWDVKSSIL